MSDVTIRPAVPEDEAQWRALWHDYNIFYQAPTITEGITAATWRRVLDAQSAMGCLVAEEGGTVRGFTLYVIHPRTWSVRDTCYMEDLYVDKTVRGRGIGRALVEELKALCVRQGLSRLYWNTQEGNLTARKLYDTIGRKDDFIRYVSLFP